MLAKMALDDADAGKVLDVFVFHGVRARLIRHDNTAAWHLQGDHSLGQHQGSSRHRSSSRTHGSDSQPWVSWTA